MTLAVDRFGNGTWRNSRKVAGAHEMSLCTGYEFCADARCAVGAETGMGPGDWKGSAHSDLRLEFHWL
jgi:hypothetical protein